MKRPLFKKVVIVGLGLMGGSLGLAIKRAGIAKTTIGLVRQEKTVKDALAIKAVDSATMDIKEAVQDADLIVLAGPVLTTPILFKLLLPNLPKQCLITDVGSTKQVLVRTMNQLVGQANKKGHQLTYIGSHPMAGSEKTGVLAAKVTLYDQSVCLLTSQGQPTTAQTKLKKFWKAVGCKLVLEVNSQQHDQLTALASHLPHALAVVLTTLVEKHSRKSSTLLNVISTGFKDTTRIAAGSPEMWTDIFISNAKEMSNAINQMEKELGKMKKLIKTKNQKQLMQLLTQVRKFRMKVDQS